MSQSSTFRLIRIQLYTITAQELTDVHSRRLDPNPTSRHTCWHQNMHHALTPTPPPSNTYSLAKPQRHKAKAARSLMRLKGVGPASDLVLGRTPRPFVNPHQAYTTCRRHKSRSLSTTFQILDLLLHALQSIKHWSALRPPLLSQIESIPFQIAHTSTSSLFFTTSYL